MQNKRQLTKNEKEMLLKKLRTLISLDKERLDIFVDRIESLLDNEGE